MQTLPSISYPRPSTTAAIACVLGWTLIAGVLEPPGVLARVADRLAPRGVFELPVVGSAAEPGRLLAFPRFNGVASTCLTSRARQKTFNDGEIKWHSH
jgi:hypothetical protein